MKGSRSNKSSAVRRRSTPVRQSAIQSKRAMSTTSVLTSVAGQTAARSSVAQNKTVRVASTRAVSTITSSIKSASIATASRRRMITPSTSSTSLVPSMAAAAAITTQKRNGGGHAALDPLGRQLPTDYQGKLHSPYEMFHDSTSTVFDPLIIGEQNPEKIVETYAHIVRTLPEEYEKTRLTITDPKELAAYEAIMGPLLTGKFPAGMKPMSAEEIVYDYKQKNRPIPLKMGHQGWGDFFVHEFYTGTTKSQLKFLIVIGVMFGSAGSLVYDAVTGLMDTFESIGEHHDH